MTTFRYLITAEDAGDQIQHFLRFKQGISRKVVISLKHLPEGILLNGSRFPKVCKNRFFILPLVYFPVEL